MIKRFRIKVTAIIMGVLTLLFIGILVAIYFASYQKSVDRTEAVLKKLCRKAGFELLDKPKNSSRYSNYFLVLVGENKEILKISNDDSGYTDKELGNMAAQLVDKRGMRGSVDNFSYYKIRRKTGTYVAFADNSQQTDYLNSLLYTMLFFGSFGVALLFLFSIGLSGWLVAPIANAFQKQKQFISDASHELKTPIAIITSNADTLEREVGEKKWIEYIRTEASRMNGLVSDLLQLAAMDSWENRNMFERLNLSELVLGIALPFESIAFEKQVNLNEEVENDIYILGDRVQLGQLIAILIDNALNYAQGNGNILVRLSQRREKKILTVSNTGEEIPACEREHIFERFYRLDKARVRENGNYGLGLAIAKSIAENHDGKISVTSKNHITTFKVVF